MYLAERFWAAVTTLVGFLSFSGVDNGMNGDQTPLALPESTLHQPLALGSSNDGLCESCFYPPGRTPESNFYCDYSAMLPKKIKPCFDQPGKGKRCWMTADDIEYNINTNYEDYASTPVGRTVNYHFEIVDKSFNADGLDFPDGKLVRDITNGANGNATFPGPWIQACWGDTVSVKITNRMRFNGTSIHWHGIRQLNTMHMDGVNGLTQCPIAPGDSFTYTWNVTQYGSSWYHSHYSVQYADGVQGPMTLYGPSVADFDEVKDPILMTDWGHNSAFEAIWNGLKKPSILVGGVGNVTRYNNKVGKDDHVHDIPPRKTWTFERGKRYLLRLINTSFDSTFVFSIDGHLMTVIEADFVPIHPYTNTSVLIGIGQRYHVIVEAAPRKPDGSKYHIDDPDQANFWVRTYKANCFFFSNPAPLGSCNPALTTECASIGYEMTGIVRYHKSSEGDGLDGFKWPVVGDPGDPFAKDCKKYKKDYGLSCVSLGCSDESYSSLVPILPWTVGAPSNSPDGKLGEELMVQFQKGPMIYPLAFAQLGGNRFNPLYTNYEDPVFLHLNYTAAWPTAWAVYPEGKHDSTDWVYMIIAGTQGNRNAHPMHLHGHDFAILQQIENAVFPDGLNIKGNNPPRRDVVLLPTNGYVIIAFKTDNPGVWLFHCHIATHASFGLANIVMERQQDANDIWPTNNSKALDNVRETCKNWNVWVENCDNWWYKEKPGEHCSEGAQWFAPDSGI